MELVAIAAVHALLQGSRFVWRAEHAAAST